MSDTWNYASIVGMLLYLSGNTRPLIGVSQVACYSHSPKHFHAAAVKGILGYLKRTSDMGIMVDASASIFDLTAFVDADFAARFELMIPPIHLLSVPTLVSLLI